MPFPSTCGGSAPAPPLRPAWAVLQEQAARLRMEVALALEDEIFRTGFQGDDPHVVHDPGEEEPFPLLGGKAEAFGQPVEKETHSPVVAGQAG